MSVPPKRPEDDEEFHRAMQMAHKALDCMVHHPDSDLAVLARQFLLAEGRASQYFKAQIEDTARLRELRSKVQVSYDYNSQYLTKIHDKSVYGAKSAQGTVLAEIDRLLGEDKQ